VEHDGNTLLGIPTTDLIAAFIEKGYSVDQATEMAADMLAVQRSRLVDERDWQKFLRVSKETLTGWRTQGGGPMYMRVGRRIFYALADLKKHASGEGKEPAK
jgi:hypothetical protein